MAKKICSECGNEFELPTGWHGNVTKCPTCRFRRTTNRKCIVCGNEFESQRDIQKCPTCRFPKKGGGGASDSTSDSASDGDDGGGMKCPSCGAVGGHEAWCFFAPADDDAEL
jgi:DNA-directed RNA polymerase subunit RPC12/RpoP